MPKRIGAILFSSGERKNSGRNPAYVLERDPVRCRTQGGKGGGSKFQTGFVEFEASPYSRRANSLLNWQLHQNFIFRKLESSCPRYHIRREIPTGEELVRIFLYEKPDPAVDRASCLLPFLTCHLRTKSDRVSM